MTKQEVPETLARLYSACLVMAELLRELANKGRDERSLDLQKAFLEGAAYVLEALAEDLKSARTALIQE